MGIYMIKDAAKELDVEAHVLRYWEEELGLTIKRNSMGHRYYDEKDIMIFKNVQELKKRGLSLKDIRDGIEKAKKEQASIKKISDESDEDVKVYSFNDFKKNKNSESPDCNPNDEKNEPDDVCIAENKDMINSKENNTEETENDNYLSDDLHVVNYKINRLQNVMNKVIANALRENKDIITASIKEEITSDVMKQFDTVMREKEEREEKRFKRLDEYLREIQRANLEAAAAKEKGFFRRRKLKQRY